MYQSSRRNGYRGRGSPFPGTPGQVRGHNPLHKPLFTGFERREPTEEELKADLGEQIDTVPISTVGSGVVDSIQVDITKFKPVASYSWRDQKDPTIIVPGHPLIWKNRPLPYAVKRDHEIVFTDQNAFRLAASPLFPLIASVTHYSPDFPLQTVDFVTDRNGLRKLWRWAAGDPNSGSFRIDLDMVGDKTILMQRWEPEDTQAPGPGYEHNFEQASTRSYPGCEDTTGHHRIVSYDFDGLHMLVRYKVDACLPASSESKGPATTSVHALNDVDELAVTLQNFLSFTPSKQDIKTEKIKKIPSSKGTLTIISKGELPPQSSLIELKTRSIYNADKMDWDETYPQLLLSQTQTMFTCIHERGTFQEIRKKTLRELSEDHKIARKADTGLRLLRKMLEAIQDVVLAEGEGARLSLICEKGEKELKVFDRKGKGELLPKDVLPLFNL